MNFFLQIKAGALQFVLFIGAIVAILLFSFVLISYSHSLFGKKTDMMVDLIQEADSGLQWAYQSNLRTGETLEIDSHNDTGISIGITKAPWGIFETYMARANHGKLSFTKYALVGNGSPQGLMALFLRDRQRPLIIAGNAKITGDVQLPQQGIRMGAVSGNAYHHHPRLIYGKEGLSSNQMPNLSEETLGEIDRLLSWENPGKNNVPFQPRMEVGNSFDAPTLQILDRTLDLEGVTLVGNILIMASEKIVVHANARLRDVLLVAPAIELKDGVQGSFQVLASKQIHVGKRCRLEYPSALVVRDKTMGNHGPNVVVEPNLLISEGTVISGAVVYLDESDNTSYTPSIKVSEKAMVLGQLYCTGNLELKGTVMGNVTTDAFIALENGSIYQNHLYQGHIDATSLSLGFVGMPMEGMDSKKTMKWLY